MFPVKIYLGDVMEGNLMEMGNRITTRRRHLGISQNVLAEKIGISNNHMSNIERGREKPSFDVLISLCNTLRVTPDYLLMGSMHPQGVPQNLVDSVQKKTLLCWRILYDTWFSGKSTTGIMTISYNNGIMAKTTSVRCFCHYAYYIL